MPDIRENVINDVVTAMSPLMDAVKLQMLEGAVRGALRGVKLEQECTELSTELDSTIHMLDCFVANKKLEGCKDSTLNQYKRTAKRLFSLLGKGYKDITKDDIRYYLAVRSPQINENSLVNEKRNLSSFFSWLHDEGYISKNPVKNIKLRGKDVEILYFSLDEEIAIREVQTNLRDKALIAFLFSTGVRVGELTKLNRSDVNLLTASVTFRGEKGRTEKFRTVYLDQWARRYLAQYLSSRTDDNPALFASTRKYGGYPRRIGNAAVEKVTKGIVKKAGIKTKGTVHVFRRTFATRLAARGCPIDIIQELMGHADPSTTLKHYIAKTGSRTKTEWSRYAFVA